MGIYLNPGSDKFKEAIRSQIYVDKTGLASYTNSVIHTRQKFVCVSRPRRFGKSMAADLLAAYYGHGTDAKELLEPYEISKDKSFGEHLGGYDAVALNMTDFLIRAGSIGAMLALIEKDVAEELSGICDADIAGDDLVTALSKVYAHTGRGFVFLIDEWDCVFRERREDTAGQRAYLDFLKLIFKDKAYVALAYMTGILPIKKYGIHSALNMFKEFSMTEPLQLERFVGFTQEEVDALCRVHDVDPDKVRAWYNGYRFRTVRAAYNPLSVVDSLLSKVFISYWSRTETFEALREYIILDFDGLRDTITKLLAGERVRVNTYHFTNDMATFTKADDVLTLLIHLGYLGYDAEYEEVFIPNREIQAEFVTAMQDGEWPEAIKAVSASQALLRSLWGQDEAAAAEGIESAHLETAHITYNSEAALSYTLSLALYAARDCYTVIRELPSGKGFADLALIPRPFAKDKPAILAELKWDQSADTAITQIHEKKYAGALKDCQGDILLVGISYDKTTKAHSCVIERA